jgi:hypothetical protein
MTIVSSKDLTSWTSFRAPPSKLLTYINDCVPAGDGMTSNPSSLTDLKGQVAMSITLGMVLDDGTKESTGGGMMSNNALLGDDEGEEEILCFPYTLVIRSTSYTAPFELFNVAINSSTYQHSPLSLVDTVFSICPSAFDLWSPHLYSSCRSPSHTSKC